MKNKFLSKVFLLSALVVFIISLAVLTTAAECSHDSSYYWNYDYANTEYHTVNCRFCGELWYEEHTWDWVNGQEIYVAHCFQCGYSDWSNTMPDHNASGCMYEDVAGYDAFEHTFSCYGCDSTYTEAHKITQAEDGSKNCSVCDWSYDGTPHECPMKIDGLRHYIYCEICGKNSDYEPHVYAENPNGTVECSVCGYGDDTIWSFDSETGKLTISGTGDMVDYENDFVGVYPPWDKYRSAIKTVEICDGVTYIGSYAFDRCTSLTNVTIPDSITSVGDYVFTGCNDLQYNVYDNAKYLGNEQNPYVYLYYSTGYDITECEISDKTKVIDSYAFCDCSDLTSVIIPNSVMSIGHHAFVWCDSLTTVTIGNSVTSIGEDAFACGSSLSEIIILSADVEIYDSSYTFSSSSATIYGYAGSTAEAYATKYNRNFDLVQCYYGNGGYCGAVGNEKNVCWEFDSESGTLTVSGTGAMADISGSAPWSDYISDIKFVVIEDGVTNVGNNAFVNIDSLTSVSLGDSVTSVGEAAFSYCDNLESVAFGNSVVSIGTEAFCECTKLSSIELPESVRSIGDFSFYSCDSLSEVVLNEGLKTIDEAAFFECRRLTSIVIPDSVVTIGGDVFDSCDGLEKVVIGESVETIGALTFYGCDKLTSVTVNSTSAVFHDANTTLPAYTAIYAYTGSAAETYATKYGRTFESIGVFGACGAEDNGENAEWRLNFNTGVLTLEGDGKIADYEISYADSPTLAPWFSYTSKIESIDIREGITRIGNYSFQNSDFTSISIPASLTDIPVSAFWGCGKVADVEVAEGNSVYSFNGEMLLKNNTNAPITLILGTLESVTVPAEATAISATAFRFCEKLKTVYVDEENPVYYADMGCVIRKDNKKLVVGSRYGAMPDYVTWIGDYAFASKPIIEIIIPESVIRIDKHAFKNCYGLENITVKGFVNTVGDNAFETDRIEGTKVIFEKQSAPTSNWSEKWNESETPLNVTWGGLVYVPEGYHLCSVTGNVETNTLYISDGIAHFGCGKCGISLKKYAAKGDALLDINFEDTIENQLEGSIKLGTASYELVNIDGRTAMHISSERVYLKDSEEYTLFKPENMVVNFDVMFGESTGTDYVESIFTFIHGHDGNNAVGEKYDYKFVLRYAKDADGNATLVSGNGQIPAETGKWYHCTVVADADNYYTFVDNVLLGTMTRGDYTNPVYKGAVCLRMADKKGSNVYFDDVNIYETDSSVSKDAPQVVVESREVYAGRDFEVNISAHNIASAKSILIDRLVYDTRSFELIGAEWKLDGASIKNWDMEEGVGVLAFSENTSLDGTILTLKFRCLDGIEGDFTLGCSVVINEEGDFGDTPIDIAYTSGTLSVLDVVRGDFNGDSLLDSNDAIYVLRHVLMPQKYPITQNCDLNEDGVISTNDAIYLLRHTFDALQYPIR